MTTGLIIRDGAEIEVDLASEFPAPSLAERKQALKAAVKAQQNIRFLAGWTHDFGAAGVHTLDLRDAGDKVNWTLLLIKAQGLVAASSGSAPVELRTQANVRIEVTASELLAALLVFLAWGEAMLSRKWYLDDAIDAAADLAALDLIDPESDWPE